MDQYGMGGDNSNDSVIVAVLANELKNINNKLDTVIEGQCLLDKVVVQHTVDLERQRGAIQAAIAMGEQGRQQLKNTIDRTKDRQEILSELPETVTKLRIELAKIGVVSGGLSGTAGAIIVAVIMNALKL